MGAPFGSGDNFRHKLTIQGHWTVLTEDPGRTHFWGCVVCQRGYLLSALQCASLDTPQEHFEQNMIIPVQVLIQNERRPTKMDPPLPLNPNEVAGPRL